MDGRSNRMHFPTMKALSTVLPPLSMFHRSLSPYLLCQTKSSLTSSENRKPHFMKATIGLEYFGKTEDQRLRLFSKIVSDSLGHGLGEAVVGKIPSRRPWVAEIIGTDPKYGFSRNFISSNTSHKNSNGRGTRGVNLWFVLESGCYYEVKEQISWQRSERYFCRVSDDGTVIRASKEEVIEWLKSR